MQTNLNFLRIFIDGCYCGIDEYDIDESKNDEDDGVTFISFDRIVKNNKIILSTVESVGLPLITLTLNLSNSSKLILDCDKNEHCRLKIQENNKIKILSSTL